MTRSPLCLVALLASFSFLAAAVEEGKPAPEVNLPSTLIEKVLPNAKDAQTLNLKDFRDKKNVVLFFYPKANTGGCRKECQAFTRVFDELAKLDTIAIGISIDKLEDQQKFTTADNLGIPLLADADGSVTKAFGAYNEERNLANRYTYVIDKKGVVRKIFTKVNPETHAGEVLEYVKANLVENKK
jgi:peroxiredoxin Q/BCP